MQTHGSTLYAACYAGKRFLWPSANVYQHFHMLSRHFTCIRQDPHDAGCIVLNTEKECMGMPAGLTQYLPRSYIARQAPWLHAE